jgi:hypothetical protein
MSYVFAIAVVLAVVGIAAWAVSALRSGGTPTDVDVDHTERTDRDEVPPAHPDRPVPGSATDRQQHGRP